MAKSSLRSITQSDRSPNQIHHPAGSITKPDRSANQETPAPASPKACQCSSRTTLASGLRTEPSGRRKPVELPKTFQGQATPLDRQPQQGSEGLVAGAGGAFSRSHLHPMALGIQLQRRLGVGRAHLRELGVGEGGRGGQWRPSRSGESGGVVGPRADACRVVHGRGFLTPWMVAVSGAGG